MSSDSIEILFWNQATIQLNRYFSICIFLFGIVGNILNIAVLSQRTLRTNPCAFLFLASSVASLIAIFSGLFTRTTAGWAADLTSSITWLCQLRTFIVFASRNIAYALLALASIDRWLSSCYHVHRRQMITLKNAQKGLILISIFSCLLYAQMFYCYEANLIDAPLRCYGKTIACRLITDLTYAFAANIIPLIIMVIFGSMTIVNVRQTARRVNRIDVISTSGGIRRSSLHRMKKLDHYLFLMLIVQVILFAVFTLPQNIQKFISLAQTNNIKSPLERAIESFIFNFFLLFAYLANGMSFYIYTLSGGNIFRNELIKLARNICPIC